MRRGLKRFFVFFFLFLLLILGGAVLAAYIFEDRISDQILTELKKQVKTDVYVQDFHLSLIRAFPEVSASLRRVGIDDTQGNLLLESDAIDFRIGYGSLFGKVRVNSVRILDGALRIRIDEQGRGNFDIFTPSPTDPEPTSSSLTVALREAQLKDIELIYENEQTTQYVFQNIKDLTLSGEFSAQQFNLKSNGELFSEFVELDGQRYLIGKDLQYEALLKVDLDQGLYNIRTFTLDVEDNTFELDGTIRQQPDGTTFDIFLTNEEGNLEAVTQLLPAQYLNVFGELSSRGDFSLEARVDGVLSETSTPEISLGLSMENGEVSSTRLEHTLEDVSFEARYSNGKYQTDRSSFFYIKEFKGYFDRELIDFDLNVNDFSDPLVDFEFDGVMPMETLRRIIDAPRLKEAQGEIEVRDLQIKGRLSELTNPRSVDFTQVKGSLEFDDAEIQLNAEPLLIDRGRLVLQGNILTMEDLKIEGAGSELLLSGECRNLVPFLLSDSLDRTQKQLRFKANLEADQMDLERLLSLAQTAPQRTARSAPAPAIADSLAIANAQSQQRFLELIQGTFSTQVQTFSYGKIRGRNFQGELIFDKGNLLVTGATDAMEGSFTVDGALYFRDSLQIQAKVEARDVDATEFFLQTNNFGQSVLTHRHVSGRLNSQMTIFAYFNPKNEFLMDELLVFAGLGINNGRLEDFELLEDFSDYVDVEDLRDIRFTNMQNWFEVRNSTIYLPALFLQSNAMNLTVSGEHTFDNAIDYNIMVNAGQVIANKFKKNKGMEPIPAKKKGFFNLYFHVYGTVEKFEYETAKREVVADFAISEARKEEIREALAQAFPNTNLISEPAAWNEEEMEYIEEFE
jgi:hypothetical protein